MSDDNLILQLAKEQGLGDLSIVEFDYLKACVTYDWYAVQPQMPYYVAQDRGIAYADLKASVSEARLILIEAFYAANWRYIGI